MLTALFALALCAPPAIEVKCDPRVELFCIVFRLSGDPQFKHDVAKSPYSDAVDAWFADHRGHDAVRMASALRLTRGISFNAVPDLAVHCDGVPSLQPLMPLEPRPVRLDARWSK